MSEGTENNAKYRNVAQNVNDSIKHNETSLCHLEEQIDRLTDALVSANADPIEMQGVYEEERAKLQFEIQEKTKLLDETLNRLHEKELEHQKELEKLQEKNRINNDSLVEQLRNSQMELVDNYGKVDALENETEKLEWELLKAGEKYKLQNENLIEQNNALMRALQVGEQDRSRDVIEDLERSLQRVTLKPGHAENEFEKNLDSMNTVNFNPTSESSPIKDKLSSETALDILKSLKNRTKELGITNQELIKIIDDLEKGIMNESTESKRLQNNCSKLKTQLELLKTEKPTKEQLERAELELKESKKLFAASEQKIRELEKALCTTIQKNETLVSDLNKTIDLQDKQIDELKKKNFYPKLMDDLKKENAQLKEEVKKLNSLVKTSPSRKVGNLKNKFEKQDEESSSPKENKNVDEEIKQKLEKSENLHREEVNHLKSKLLILEKKLNQSLEENALLNQELNDAMEQLDENSFNYESVLHDLQSKLETSVTDITDPYLEQQLADLKKHLESEKSRNQNLSFMLSEYEKSPSKCDEKWSLPPPPSSPPPNLTTEEVKHSEVKIIVSSENDVVSESPHHPSTPDVIPNNSIEDSKFNKTKPPLPISPKPNTMKVMSDKLNKLRQEDKQKEVALKKANQNLTNLKSEMENLQATIRDQNSEIAKLKLQVDRGISVSITPNPYNDFSQLEEELENNKKDKYHLEETIDIITEEHEAQIIALQGELDQMKSERNDFHDNEDLLDELAREQAIRSNLESKVEDLEFQLSNKNAGKESEESLNNLENNLELADKMCEELMSEKEKKSEKDEREAYIETEEILSEKDKIIEDLKSENANLVAEIEQLNSEFADISTEIAEADNQYGQRIENLQKQIENINEDHEIVIEGLQEELNHLKKLLDEEKNSDLIETLEQENMVLSDECKLLTDKLASDILSKISPADDKVDIIEEMKSHYEKANDRHKTDLELKKQKIGDLQEDLKRMNANYARKIASLKEEQKIKEEHAKLKIEEHLLTNGSITKELEQMKKINKRYEQNLSSKNDEFNEVVTKLLNLENLIEIQQDNMLAKDEKILSINRQLENLRAELDITQQRHNILKEESLTLDVLESSLNEVSEHEKYQEGKIFRLEKQLKETVSTLNKLQQEKKHLSDKLKEESEFRDFEMNATLEENEATIENLKKKMTNLETQLEAQESNDVKINKIKNQDRTKNELVCKNIELERKYDLLMEKFVDIEEEKSVLLDDIDINFKTHTDTVKELESEIKQLKKSVSEKDNLILEKEEELNTHKAKHLSDSQLFFETRKLMESQITDFKTKLMEYEGGDAMRRSESVHSVWLEDTSNLNHIIGEKDKQIRDLRDSLRRSSIAGSIKSSCVDINFHRTSSISSIPPPTDIDIEGNCLPDNDIAIDNYKTQINQLYILMNKKDEEYTKLYQKFKQELDNQNRDSNVYNDHFTKLQEIVALYEHENDKLTNDNKHLIEKSSKGINDVNESLTKLNDELQLESERTNEVLSELDLLKEEIDEIQQVISCNRNDKEYEKVREIVDKVCRIEDNVAMTVEEHQCSLDHYQLLLQTTQQEMQLVNEELHEHKPSTNKEKQKDSHSALSKILEIVQEKVKLVTEKLSETKDEVTSSRFRGSQNGKSDKENAVVIEQAQLKCKKYDNEIESIKNIIGNYNNILKLDVVETIADEVQELKSQMSDLKDLLSLQQSTSSILKPQKIQGIESESYDNMNVGDSVLEKPVSLQEIDGLECITHNLRHQLREKTKECEELKQECDSMNQSMKHLQSVFGDMLSAKTVAIDTLNDTMNTEKQAMEFKLSQLSDVIEYKDKSQDQLRNSLSFEQGRVQQLKEDLDTTYEKTFEHIKEYEGRVSTITERLNLQQQQVKAKMEASESQVTELKRQNKELKRQLKEKDNEMEDLDNSHKKAIRAKQRLLKKAQDESKRYFNELEDVKNTISQNHGSFDEQLSQYGSIMSKFKSEISEEKEAFQNSLKKLNYLVEDRTHKIKEYENIVRDLQNSLVDADVKLKAKDNLNETLMQEKSKLKLALLNKTVSREDEKQKENEISLLRNKTSRAEQQMSQMRETLDDIKFRYEKQLSNKADEVLKAKMKLEKVEIEIRNKTEENLAISDEVRRLKMEVEEAGSDNQVKDLEQKLASKQSEVDEAVYRMERCQRESSALKDVLASYQNGADNDIAYKISEYETTIADYEVQVNLLKKNISDLHTKLHITYDERQKVIEKAQNQMSVYQRRLEQMSDRVDDAKATAKREAEAHQESKKNYQNRISALEQMIKDNDCGDAAVVALKQKIVKLERQLANERVVSTDQDIQQRFELAVKRADHLQEQVDTTRKTNKRIQKTVEDLWTENTQLLKELNKNQEASSGRKESSSRRTTDINLYEATGKRLPDDIPNVIGTADI